MHEAAGPVAAPAADARGVTTRTAHNDYEIKRKAEEEVRAVLDHLSAQDEALTKIDETLAARMSGRSQD